MSADGAVMSPKSSLSDEVGDTLNCSSSEITLFESPIETLASPAESKKVSSVEITPKKKTTTPSKSTPTTPTRSVTKTRPVSTTPKPIPSWRTTGIVSSSPYSAFGSSLPRLTEKTIRSKSTPRTSSRSSADSASSSGSTARIKRSQDTEKLISKVSTVTTPKVTARERRSAGESRISSTTQSPSKAVSSFAPFSPPSSPAKKRLLKPTVKKETSGNGGSVLSRIDDEKEPKDMSAKGQGSSKTLTTDKVPATPDQKHLKPKQKSENGNEGFDVSNINSSTRLPVADSQSPLSPDVTVTKPSLPETLMGAPTPTRHESEEVNMFKQARFTPEPEIQHNIEPAETKAIKSTIHVGANPNTIYPGYPEPIPQQQLAAVPPQQTPAAVIQRPKFKLDDFQILNTLGTGSFGRVHLVKMKSDGKFYALKVLKKSEIVKLRQVEHTINEKSILETLDCRFIVNLYGTFSDCTNLYFLMDFVSGGELFSYLRRSGRFPDQVAKFYAAEVVLAFEYLHSKDVIYRDLKPENLLLDASGHIKITDFGFAKLVPDVTWTLCGTPDYLAPEIIQSKGYGRAVDWWALGVLIYEMLAGHPPFFDEDHFKLYEKILACKLRFPSHFDPYAKDLVKRLLQPDLTRRYGNLKDGALDIKRHRWFADVNWDKLSRWEVKVPYQPKISHEGDSSNFDQYPEDFEPYGATGPDPYREKFKDF